MSSTDDLLKQSRKPDARRVRPDHPKGWEPGIAWRGKEGTVISEPTDERDPEWDTILQHFQFDPEHFEVVEPIEVRSWEGFIKNDRNEIEKTTLWYHKAKVVRRFDDDSRADIEALVKEVRSHKPRRQTIEGAFAIVAALADWQIGKKGTTGAVQRILDDFDDIVRRAKALRKAGVAIGPLYLWQAGDIVENTAGHYAQQTYTVELSRVEQMRLARRLLVSGLKKLAPHFERIIVPVTPGNHPENRLDGKSYTDFADNDDLEIAVQVQEILAENPDAYGHVSFVIPDDEMSVTLDVCGTVVAFAHGHQFPKKRNEFAWEWWDGQARGMKPPGDATLLLSAHRHHLVMEQRGIRTWIQAPTNDSGSDWFEIRTGETTIPGTLTLVVGSDGWRDLQIL